MRPRPLLAAARRLSCSTKGATTAEYGLIVGLLAMIAIASMGSFGSSLAGVYDDANGQVTSASASASGGSAGGGQTGGSGSGSGSTAGGPGGTSSGGTGTGTGTGGSSSGGGGTGGAGGTGSGSGGNGSVTPKDTTNKK